MNVKDNSNHCSPNNRKEIRLCCGLYVGWLLVPTRFSGLTTDMG